MQGFLILLSLMIGFVPLAQAGGVNVAERSKLAFDVVLESGWPSLPSDNIRRTEYREPSPYLRRIFDSLLKRSGLPQSEFQLKITSYGEVVCDSQRKLVLADPMHYAMLTRPSTHIGLVLTALFAHEMGHYVLDVYKHVKGEALFGPKPFVVGNRTMPDADTEHAQVEPIAAEIMRRAGYHVGEIRLAFRLLHGRIDTVIKQFQKEMKSRDANTDVATRKWVIKKYLEEEFGK